MTEDEAKQRWCPFMKGDEGNGESSASCLGSACMAWRTRDRYRDCEERSADQSPGADWVAAEGEPGLWLLAHYEVDGFCGLAGAPQ